MSNIRRCRGDLSATDSSDWGAPMNFVPTFRRRRSGSPVPEAPPAVPNRETGRQCMDAVLHPDWVMQGACLH
jgi:hypothetical protein